MQLAWPTRPVVAAGTVEVEGGVGAQLREARSEGDILGVEGLLDLVPRAPMIQRPGLAIADRDEQRRGYEVLGEIVRVVRSPDLMVHGGCPYTA